MASLASNWERALRIRRKQFQTWQLSSPDIVPEWITEVHAGNDLQCVYKIRYQQYQQNPQKKKNIVLLISKRIYIPKKTYFYSNQNDV